LLSLFTPIIIRHTVHAYNDSWKISPFGNRILDEVDFHFVHSAAVQTQRAPRLHPLMARVAFEVSGPLMLDENALAHDEMDWFLCK
jgi:hypothetical protein